MLSHPQSWLTCAPDSKVSSSVWCRQQAGTILLCALMGEGQGSFSHSPNPRASSHACCRYQGEEGIGILSSPLPLHGRLGGTGSALPLSCLQDQLHLCSLVYCPGQMHTCGEGWGNPSSGEVSPPRGRSNSSIAISNQGKGLLSHCQRKMGLAQQFPITPCANRPQLQWDY